MSLSRGLWFRKEERGPWVWGWVFFRGGHYSSRLMFIWRISTCFRGVINPQVEEKSIEFATFSIFLLSGLCQLYCKESLYSDIKALLTWFVRVARRSLKLLRLSHKCHTSVSNWKKLLLALYLNFKRSSQSFPKTISWSVNDRLSWQLRENQRRRRSFLECNARDVLFKFVLFADIEASW